MNSNHPISWYDQIYQHDNPETPSYGWIQWKGTDVCVDLHCACGEQTHYDGDFLYYWVCPYCDRLWEMGTHISRYEVATEHRSAVLERSRVEHPSKEMVVPATMDPHKVEQP